MILDSSALVAILRHEGRAEVLADAIERADRCAVSAATYVEASLVVTAALHGELDDLLDRTGTEIVPVDAAQARLARRAYATYGRRSGSAARLNFGDCFSYALATTRSEPLLFVGDDFRHTDVIAALPD